MTKENIISFQTSDTQQQSSPSLQNVMDLLQTWRLGKKKRNEKIPDGIWDKIFILLETMNTTRLLAALGLTQGQLHSRRLELQGANTHTTKEPEKESQDKKQPIEFCEAKPEFPLEYKPAKAFSTTTSVVELYRPDGMLMKIHISTDRFEDLLRAFFKG